MGDQAKLQGTGIPLDSNGLWMPSFAAAKELAAKLKESFLLVLHPRCSDGCRYQRWLIEDVVFSIVEHMPDVLVRSKIAVSQHQPTSAHSAFEAAHARSNIHRGDPGTLVGPQINKDSNREEEDDESDYFEPGDDDEPSRGLSLPVNH